MKKFFIFLDIDGVLNSYAYFSSKRYKERVALMGRSNETEFDYIAISRLNRLISFIEQNGYRPVLVLSSSWKLDTTIDQINSLLSSNGFQYDIEHYTPNVSLQQIIQWWEDFSRDYEIVESIKELWIEDNYIIIDDNDFFKEERSKHFIETSYNKWLTVCDIEKAKQLFLYLTKQKGENKLGVK